MKISPQTLEVLKNIAGINSTFIMEEEDNVLRTKTVAGNQIVFAKVPETFPKFAIYDLKDFLPVAGMFPDADFEFGSDSVVVSSGKSKFRYSFCSEKLIDVRPPRNSRMPEPDVVIEKLERSTFKTLMQAASALSIENVVFKSEKGKILACTQAGQNQGNSNVFSIELGDAPIGMDFEFIFSSAIFKFIPGDYKVKFAGKKIAEFSCVLGPEHSVTYWIGMDPSSTMTRHSPE